jgi:hypothetical protein
MTKLLCILAFAAISCHHNSTQNETEALLSETDRFIDSINIARQADSMTKAVIRNAFFDTAGIAQAPVKVLSAKLVTQEYSNSKDIRLVWKNVSGNKIAAIRFKWYGLNAFGEPADMGGSGVIKGIGGGLADRSLSPGKTDSGEWSIMSNDGKKIILAWPYEVAFEDGTKWKCGK